MYWFKRIVNKVFDTLSVQKRNLDMYLMVVDYQIRYFILAYFVVADKHFSSNGHCLR